MSSASKKQQRRLSNLHLAVKEFASLSRRSFVVGTVTAIAAPLLVKGLVNIADALAAEGEAVRRSAHSLHNTDPEVKLLRDAVQKLKLDGNAVGSWTHLASYHKIMCGPNWPVIDWDQEVHFGWWFLPWHRLQLLVAERHLQAAVEETSLALAYWDWYENAAIPEIYLGQDNPLNDPTRAPKGPKMGRRDLGVLTEAEMIDFDSFGPFGGREPPTGLGELPGFPGRLETGPHNGGHGFIMGNMRDFATAALDPIFYAHHGNIDRLWEVWRNAVQPGTRVPPSESRWKTRPFSFQAPQSELQWLVADTVDLSGLGYRYDTIHPKEAIVMVQASELVGPLAAGGEISVDLGSAANKMAEFDLAGSGISVKPQLPKEPGLSTALSETPAAELASNRKLILRLEGVKLPSQSVAIDVHLNTSAPASSLAPDEASYVGSINLVPPRPGIAMKGGGITAEIDLSRRAKDADGSVADLTLTLVPYDPDGKITSESVKVDRLELLIQ